MDILLFGPVPPKLPLSNSHVLYIKPHKRPRLGWQQHDKRARAGNFNSNLFSPHSFKDFSSFWGGSDCAAKEEWASGDWRWPPFEEFRNVFPFSFHRSPSPLGISGVPPFAAFGFLREGSSPDPLWEGGKASRKMGSRILGGKWRCVRRKEELCGWREGKYCHRWR